ncbi:MAG: hypothetical protein ACR2MX_08730 [Cyclobacteriaceae bacterium]
MIKHFAPFVLLFALLALSLCTRENNEDLTPEKTAQIETMDSVAAELKASIETIESETQSAEETIDALLDEVEESAN